MCMHPSSINLPKFWKSCGVGPDAHIHLHICCVQLHLSTHQHITSKGMVMFDVWKTLYLVFLYSYQTQRLNAARRSITPVRYKSTTYPAWWGWGQVSNAKNLHLPDVWTGRRQERQKVMRSRSRSKSGGIKSVFRFLVRPKCSFLSQIPGLAESRPSVLRGDSLYVRPSGSKPGSREWQGRVEIIHKEEVGWALDIACLLGFLNIASVSNTQQRDKQSKIFCQRPHQNISMDQLRCRTKAVCVSQVGWPKGRSFSLLTQLFSRRQSHHCFC